VCTGDNWRKTHNYRHHTYTNVRGLDDDIGYGLLRLFPEQRWKPFYLVQPLIAVVLCGAVRVGRGDPGPASGALVAGMSRAQLRKQLPPGRTQDGAQVYATTCCSRCWPAPFFLPVLLGNVVANVMRNLWTYTIIFCGHFTADAETFPRTW
jgi:fatty acid desaturase